MTVASSLRRDLERQLGLVRALHAQARAMAEQTAAAETMLSAMFARLDEAADAGDDFDPDDIGIDDGGTPASDGEPWGDCWVGSSIPAAG